VSKRRDDDVRYVGERDVSIVSAEELIGHIDAAAQGKVILISLLPPHQSSIR